MVSKTKNNLINLEDEIEQKYAKKGKRKKPKMKVSGAKVKKLQKIIADKK